MRRSIFVTLLLLISSPAWASPIYGNDSGCVAYKNGGATGNDRSLYTTDNQSIFYMEGGCDLPPLNGVETTVNCAGEGEEWTETVSATQSGANLIVYIFGRTETLHPCE